MKFHFQPEMMSPNTVTCCSALVFTYLQHCFLQPVIGNLSVALLLLQLLL